MRFGANYTPRRQGHLSGFEFYPSWTQTRHARNIFTEPKAVAAQADDGRALR